jgi:hypothetical protein
MLGGLIASQLRRDLIDRFVQLTNELIHHRFGVAALETVEHGVGVRRQQPNDAIGE